MSRTTRSLCILFILLGLGLCPTPGAETIHTWVDAQGVRHFSQYPPVDTNQPAETIRLEPLPAASDAGERLQTIRDVTRDLELSRQQREEQRARGAPPPQYEPPVIAPSYVPPYPYAAPYPPFRPRPHRPERPDPDEPEDNPAAPPREFTTPGVQVRP